MDLQPIFDEPIVEQGQFEPAYDGHGGGVHRVRTPTGWYVVRLARQGSRDDPFWYGVEHLFGLDPTRMTNQEVVGQRLSAVGGFRIPRVLRRGVHEGRSWIVVEYLPGRMLTSFGELSTRAMEQYGADLASVHFGETFAEYGDPAGGYRRPLRGFHTHVASTVEAVLDRFQEGDRSAGLHRVARDMSTMAEELPPPENASIAHVDIDPTQYLADGDGISALVDLEAHVVAPRELDFVALEYVLTTTQADALARGYSGVATLPDLSAVRPLYRFLCLLLEIQDNENVSDWMGRPILFGRG